MMRKPPRRGSMRTVDKTLIYSVMFEQGILPIEDPSFDMRRALDQLPPEEARCLKRKFRKLWRKCVRQSTVALQDTARSLRTGMGKQNPTKKEKAWRKELVRDCIWQEKIEPLIKAFENPENENNANNEKLRSDT